MWKEKKFLEMALLLKAMPRVTTFSGIIRQLKKSRVRDVVNTRIEREELPSYGCDVDGLGFNESVVKALRRSGVLKFFKFQEDAIRSIQQDKNVLVVAGTSMGKTESFLAPVLDYAVSNLTRCAALLIYPTKALAADQMARISGLTQGMFGVSFAKYDGDTSDSERNKIMINPPSIFITNPDMLHFHLKDPWIQELLSSLKFVIVDEVHNYAGVFGSHVHYIIQRMKRFLNKKCQFIGSSATIGNPKDFVELLFREEFTVITSEKDWRGKRSHVMLEPLHSKYTEAVYLTEMLTQSGFKTMVFADSHLSSELVKSIADERRLGMGIHRAGLLKEHRRTVEKEFKDGQLKTVVATPTLEQGIDIGDLDAVVLMKVPPTFTRYVQRVGRAGRKGRESGVFLIIGDDPISNYYATHPDEFYNSSPEPAYMDPENPEVLRRQIVSMAYDQPLASSEEERLCNEIGSLSRVISKLVNEEYLQRTKSTLVPTRRGVGLHRATKLRGTGESVRIYTMENKYIGERGFPMAARELHTEAIYLHGGKEYRVMDFNPRRVVVEHIPYRSRFFTIARYHSDIKEFKLELKRKAYGVELTYGAGIIDHVVDGYYEKDRMTEKTVAENDLEKSITYDFPTKIINFKLPLKLTWTPAQKGSATHAAEHILISAAVTLTGADTAEMGGISYSDGSIVIYDGAYGGSGLTHLLYDRMERDLVRGAKMLAGCRCGREDGCPKCTYSPYCGNNNKYLWKDGALTTLKRILKGKATTVEEKPVGKSTV
jgi:DEAD/DEAH box helicase domain-containing protein